MNDRLCWGEPIDPRSILYGGIMIIVDWNENDERHHRLLENSSWLPQGSLFSVYAFTMPICGTYRTDEGWNPSIHWHGTFRGWRRRRGLSYDLEPFRL
jgi:hypothetical protein